MSLTHPPAPSGTPDEADWLAPVLDRVRDRVDAGDVEVVEQFAWAAYRRAAAQQLATIDADAVAAMLVDAFAFMESRSPGHVALRVFNATAEAHGWVSKGTVVEANLDDGPFLLTTITEELARLGLDVADSMHPVMGVRRDEDGRIAGVLPARQAQNRESWIHIELIRRLDGKAQKHLAERLTAVLDDARRATAEFPAMRAQLEEVAFQTRASAGSRYRADEVDEAISLLNWLLDDHFVLLGFREYDLVETPKGPAANVRPDSGLGILQNTGSSRWAEPVLLSDVEPRLREQIEGGELLIVSRTNAVSTVHRQVRMIYVGVKKVSGDGRILGEYRIIGLFAQKAFAQPATTIPVLRRKLRQILEREDIVDHSYDERALRTLFDAFPKHELFAADTDDLRRTLVELLEIQRGQDVRLLLRSDESRRSISALVAVPRGRFNAATRMKVQQLLVERHGATSVDYHLTMTERDQALLHFVLHADRGTLAEVSAEVLEQEVVALTRTWNDDLLAELIRVHGPVEGRRLAARYIRRFPAGYAETTSVATALLDIAELERVCQDMLETSCSMKLRADHQNPDMLRFVLYQMGGGVELSQFVPVLESLGLTVVEEIPYRLETDDDDGGPPLLHIHDFGVRASAAPVDVENDAERASRAAMAIFEGKAAADRLNRLVLRSGLEWEDVVVLRSYRRYRRQVGTTFSQAYLDDALVGHPDVARALVDLFDAKFDPQRNATADEQEQARERVLAACDAVDRLDTDRILRGYLGMIDATLRTNRYISLRDEAPRPYLSLKLDSGAVPDMPKPVPYREIFVASPEMEGVHLRGGPVARGGLRWSDRLEDYRTEVLGLMKAQMVKNAVIVPTGSKGGFVLKNPPEDAAQLRLEVQRQYEIFIRGLLDLTDDVELSESGDGTPVVVAPPRVRRLDGDDPYLVVAADRGTATFSDIANAISAEYGFWLGDAFASGGSRGYDHKAMGITARGAWVAVQRHFRELDIDVQTESIDVVGIGDMSGDVFGNGMLRSDAIRLVAAFDHRHVFVDPDPDPKASFAERRRLFELQRSSWDDYDRSLISAGGGVWSRTAKSIPLAPRLQEMLRASADTISPPELIKALLRMPADLLFAGGIGTFVKAGDETSDDVGDRANDAIRVDASEVGARVVGEGGNLAITQRGRIQFARRGGRLNTDAIDNSAGVDTSDHEVNLKILLDLAVSEKEITGAERDDLLVAMADEVAADVLNDVYQQTAVITQELAASATSLDAYEALMRDLEAPASTRTTRDDTVITVLEREVEILPSPQEMERRRQAGAGLARPELAVLVGYSKVDLTTRLLETQVPDEGYLAGLLHEYFPSLAGTRFEHHMGQHRLRRELVATRLANDLVNRMGLTYVSRTAHEMGTRSADVALAYLVARDIADANGHWRAIEAQDGRMAPALQLQLKAEVDRLVDAYTRTYLRSGFEPVAETVERDGAVFARLHAAVVAGRVGNRVVPPKRQLQQYIDLGVDETLAQRILALRELTLVPDVAAVARAGNHAFDMVAEVFFELTDRLPLDELGSVLTSVTPHGHWQRWQHRGLLDDLRDLRRTAAAQALALAGDETEDPAAAVTSYLARRSAPLERVGTILDMLSEQEDIGTSAVAVAVRALREIVRPTEPLGR
jgi:glutamate dehydrogenase